jgi:hypothetical protein
MLPKRTTIPSAWVATMLLLSVASAAPLATPPHYDVWFGEGCFWERQYAYVNLELNQTGPFKRSNRTITSVVGYAGAKGTGDDGLVCYENDSSNDYGSLGYAEAVGMTLSQVQQERDLQFTALVSDFYGSFTPTKDGFMRPDLPPLLPYGDVGPDYRTMVGIPGGVDGPLFSILKALNTPRGPYKMTMNLKPDLLGNMTQDEDNTVWVMDSNVFPFYRAEQYHQFHSNFFHNPEQPEQYPAEYLHALYQLQIDMGKIAPTGCSDSYCPKDSSGNCHY